MAKSKDKAKKRKKAKDALPKRIAGVKVPKAVRRSRFGELLASRTGQAMIAEALLGAGALAVGKKAADSPKVRRLAQEAREETVHKGEEVAHEASHAGATLAYALGEAARTFAEALRHGEVPSREASGADEDEPVWAADYGGPDPAGGSAGRKKVSAKKQPTAQEAGPL